MTVPKRTSRCRAKMKRRVLRVEGQRRRKGDGRKGDAVRNRPKGD